jgi:hypothetical protein
VGEVEKLSRGQALTPAEAFGMSRRLVYGAVGLVGLIIVLVLWFRTGPLDGEQ